MESVIDIQALSQRAGAGETAAFETLYQHMVERVFAYVVSRVSTREVAHELTQDTFIALYRALPKFAYQSDAAFYGFVFTIVKRQLAQHYEKNRTTQTQEFNEAEHAIETAVEANLAVTQALASLEDVTREIVVLHHWSRFTFGEIAVMLSMTESAVRVRHHRALQSLKGRLTAELS